MVSRFLVYALLFTISTTYFALNVVRVDFYAFFGLVFGTTSSAVFWIEAVREARKREGPHQPVQA